MLLSHTELEAIAANVPPSKPFIMSPSEAKFIAYLIVKYGTNYKVIVGATPHLCPICFYIPVTENG